MSQPRAYLPKGAIYRVTLEIAVPIVATEAQAHEWIAHGVGARWTIEQTNPLSRHKIETWGGLGCKIEFTGDVGTKTEHQRGRTATGGFIQAASFSRARA